MALSCCAGNKEPINQSVCWYVKKIACQVPRQPGRLFFALTGLPVEFHRGTNRPINTLSPQHKFTSRRSRHPPSFNQQARTVNSEAIVLQVFAKRDFAWFFTRSIPDSNCQYHNNLPPLIFCLATLFSAYKLQTLRSTEDGFTMSIYNSLAPLFRNDHVLFGDCGADIRVHEST